jgi:hypothetical protein
MKKFLDSLAAFISTRRFFWIIIGIFLFSAIWISLSADFSEAFDENFHFGLVQVYSHYWLPFLTRQPPNANAYGAVTRDNSYLFHYLMSFPYRITTLFTKSLMVQVIVLRLIDVAMFAYGIYIFQKVLIRAGISAGLTNMVLFVFVMIPITPQLAGQINYDDLIFPCVAWATYLSFDVIDSIKAKKVQIKPALSLLILCLFTSIVKYTFLPIFLGISIYLIYLLFRQYQGHVADGFKSLWTSWKRTSRRAQIILVILLVISFGMFAQRYAINLAEYHAISPDCSSVLSVKACSAYSPWYYDYVTHAGLLKQGSTVKFDNPLNYLFQWIYWMWYRLYFAISGVNNSYQNFPPLPIVSGISSLVFVVGAALLAIYRKKIFKNNQYLVFFFIISVCYLAILWTAGYSEYHYTNVLQAMNGRYLLPVLILVGAYCGKGFSLLLKKSNHQKAAVSLVVAVLLLQGGGVLTFISRSNATWYWPNQTVIDVNSFARKITKPVLYAGQVTYNTKLWIFN